jgi:ferredoxin-NADP reductase
METSEADAYAPVAMLDPERDPDEPAVRELYVASTAVVAEDVVELVLVDPDDRALPSWEPGAHIDLLLENCLERQYSLCGDPGDAGRWRLAVGLGRPSRGGSAYVHDAIRQGDRVRVRGPRNNFAMVRSDRYLFIAGGIGITPILPMVHAAASAGAEWRLLYGGRALETMAFRNELSRYGSRVTFTPEDRDGLLDLEGALGSLSDGTHVYCCGPEPLLEVAERVSSQRPGITLHVERFAPKEPLDRGKPGDEPFEVVCRKSGITLQVHGGESILEVARAAGVRCLSSCTEGTCGTCETEVIEGVPDHRDSFLSEDERADNETMMICVSRAAPGSRIVLDL